MFSTLYGGELGGGSDLTHGKQNKNNMLVFLLIKTSFLNEDMIREKEDNDDSQQDSRSNLLFLCLLYKK